MEIITVEPVYGFGWMRGSKEEPLPSPFEIEVLQRKESNRVIWGRVIEVAHPYRNYWIRLGLRASAIEGDDFNAYIYDRELSSLDDDHVRQPLVTGFAIIRGRGALRFSRP